MGSLDELKARQRAAATQLTEVFMDEILGKAARIAPLEEGTLSASSGRTTTQTAAGVEVTGYFSTVYARRQHEETGYAHRAGRQAKYLEQPFKAAIGRYPAALARALRTVT